MLSRLLLSLLSLISNSLSRIPDFFHMAVHRGLATAMITFLVFLVEIYFSSLSCNSENLGERIWLRLRICLHYGQGQDGPLPKWHSWYLTTNSPVPSPPLPCPRSSRCAVGWVGRCVRQTEEQLSTVSCFSDMEPLGLPTLHLFSTRSVMGTRCCVARESFQDAFLC